MVGATKRRTADFVNTWYPGGSRDVGTRNVNTTSPNADPLNDHFTRSGPRSVADLYQRPGGDVSVRLALPTGYVGAAAGRLWRVSRPAGHEWPGQTVRYRGYPIPTGGAVSPHSLSS